MGGHYGEFVGAGDRHALWTWGRWEVLQAVHVVSQWVATIYEIPWIVTSVVGFLRRKSRSDI